MQSGLSEEDAKRERMKQTVTVAKAKQYEQKRLNIGVRLYKPP